MSAVREALRSDAEKPLVASDPYGAGKEMAALGRLAIIADELGDESTAKAVRSRLAAGLEAWLTGKNADALVYEGTWGGVASSNGLADQGERSYAVVVLFVLLGQVEKLKKIFLMQIHLF